MKEEKDKDSQLTQEVNIDRELSTIIEKNILPRSIVAKIGIKLKDKHINLTKDQFNKLIKKIQSELKGYTSDEPALKQQERYDRYSSSSKDDATMIELIHSLDNLEKRIQEIEENNLIELKKLSEKVLIPNNIKTIEKINSPILSKMDPLREIPYDPESVVVIMKWLQYLVDKLGKNNLADILGYYVDIDWISDDVRLDLIKYSKGISDDKETVKKASHNLSTKEHIQSLLYIQKLKGQHMDEKFIWKIDREIEKMSKSIEEYQFK
ncbi:MAG: FlaD/FlaE family flagellar protein [Thermoplasmatota archaeon]